MLPRSERLTSTQFDRAFSRAQSVRHPLVVVRAHRRSDDDESTRAAFVVPKKQGKATGRNRVRRRLRERYRLHPRRGDLAGCDLIFLSTPETGHATNEQLDAALDEVLRRLSKKIGGGTARVGDAQSAASGPHFPSNAAKSNDASSPDEGQSRSGAAGPRGAMAPASEGELGVERGEVAAAETLNSPVPGRVARWALTLIRFYQRFISPSLPPSCRFIPTCSHYTYAAIERFGVGRGVWLGTCRVCRCNPFHAGGIDPVPESFPNTVSIKKLEKSLSWRRQGSSHPTSNSEG